MAGHLQQVILMLFLMLGPFKIIIPFVRITRNGDAVITRKIAFHSIFFSILALLIAALIGDNILRNYGIPLHILSLAAGIILFLVALLNILSQFDVSTDVPADEPPPTLKMALIPLAFPKIVTPYGAAAVIVFMAMAPDHQSRLLIGAIIILIMLLNIVVMLTAKKLLHIYVVVLPVLGAILGIVQVALGLQIMVNAVRQILNA